MVRNTIWEFNYQVYEVDRDDNTIATVAAANNFYVADAAFKTAKTTCTRSILQMRNRARIIKTERSERGWDEQDRPDHGASG